MTGYQKRLFQKIITQAFVEHNTAETDIHNADGRLQWLQVGEERVLEQILPANAFKLVDFDSPPDEVLGVLCDWPAEELLLVEVEVVPVALVVCAVTDEDEIDDAERVYVSLNDKSVTFRPERCWFLIYGALV